MNVLKPPFIAILFMGFLFFACGEPAKEEQPDITGVYTLGGHEDSWALTVTTGERGFEATFYKLDGMLPPKNIIPGILKELEPIGLETFLLDSDLSFRSEFGPGQFGKEEGQMKVTFLELESHVAPQLTLTRQ